MGHSINVNGVDDAADFQVTKNAMNVMSITAQEQAAIWSLLSGILWLGNIDFNEKGDVATVKNQQGTFSCLLSLLFTFFDVFHYQFVFH
jgi:myosin heavy subunit